MRIETPVRTVYHRMQLIDGVLKDDISRIVFLKMILWILWTKFLNNNSEKVHFQQSRKFIACIFINKWNPSEVQKFGPQILVQLHISPEQLPVATSKNS